MKVTDWERGEAKRAASICFKAWLSRRGNRGSSDIEAAIHQLRAFLERNGSSRFLPRNPTYNNCGLSAVFNRAGFRDKMNNGECTYYVLPEVFQGEMCAGYDYRTIARELAKRGHMEHDEARLTKKMRLPEFGSTNTYVILPSFLSEPETPTVATLPI